MRLETLQPIDEFLVNVVPNEELFEQGAEDESRESVVVVVVPLINSVGSHLAEHSVGVPFIPVQEDYTVLFAITQDYWEEIQNSMEHLMSMGCLCIPHTTTAGLNEGVSIARSGFMGLRHEGHAHCEHCGGELVDGVCPDCSCTHTH